MTYTIFIGDGYLRLWDITSPPKCTVCLNVGCGELLTCNWNKYQEVMNVIYDVDISLSLSLSLSQNILCTAGVDTTLRCMHNFLFKLS